MRSLVIVKLSRSFDHDLCFAMGNEPISVGALVAVEFLLTLNCSNLLAATVQNLRRMAKKFVPMATTEGALTT
jgi:hypothetical protein